MRLPRVRAPRVVGSDSEGESTVLESISSQGRNPALIPTVRAAGVGLSTAVQPRQSVLVLLKADESADSSFE